MHNAKMDRGWFICYPLCTTRPLPLQRSNLQTNQFVPAIWKGDQLKDECYFTGEDIVSMFAADLSTSCDSLKLVTLCQCLVSM